MSQDNGPHNEPPGAAEVKDPQMEALRTVVLEACTDMLASAGCTGRPIDPGTSSLAEKRDLAGFIGFSGQIRGSLTIAGSADLFRVTYPVMGTRRTPSQVDLFDWTSEMANQILGRVKRRLCQRGTDFDASLPMAIEGRALWWRYPARARALDLCLAVIPQPRARRAGAGPADAGAGDGTGDTDTPEPMGGEVLTVHFEITDAGDGKIFPDAAEPISHSVEGDTLLF